LDLSSVNTILAGVHMFAEIWP